MIENQGYPYSNEFIMQYIEEVAAYVRVSTTEQKLHGLSIESQKQKLVEYAENHNMKIVECIERIMTIDDDQDIRRATARRIELAIIGPVGDHTCYLTYENSTATEQINKLLAEVEYWRKENDRKAKIIDKYLD